MKVGVSALSGTVKQNLHLQSKNWAWVVKEKRSSDMLSNGVCGNRRYWS